MKRISSWVQTQTESEKVSDHFFQHEEFLKHQEQDIEAPGNIYLHPATLLYLQ